MSLTVAVQMDPLETISIKGDSTFALMLEAQARGHRLFEYPAERLTYEDGSVCARAPARSRCSASKAITSRPGRRSISTLPMMSTSS